MHKQSMSITNAREKERETMIDFTRVLSVEEFNRLASGKAVLINIQLSPRYIQFDQITMQANIRRTEEHNDTEHQQTTGND